MQSDAGSRQPVEQRSFTSNLSPADHWETDKDWSDVEEEQSAISGVETWTSGAYSVPKDRHPSHRQDYIREPSRIIQPGTDRDWSATENERPFDTSHLSAVEERLAPAASVTAVGKGMQTTSPPLTVCHVSVTVRQRSPRGTSNSTPADSREPTPVPVLRRSGAPSKRSSPAGRRVTFSELPPNDNQRRPTFAAPRCLHNASDQAALDTLWHYHDTYPSMTSSSHLLHGLAQFGADVPARLRDHRVSSPDSRSPETAQNENGNENAHKSDDVITLRVERLATCERPGEITDRPVSYSTPHDDDATATATGDDLNHHQQEQDQGSGVDEASLSIKELVASFESMTSPYMRAPAIARRAL